MPASILTVLGALVIPLAAFVAGGMVEHPSVRLAAMVAAPLSIALAAWFGRRKAAKKGEASGSAWTWVFVAALSVVAAQYAHATGSVVLGDGQPPAEDDWPLYDLTQEQVPTPTSGYVEITGYLHDQWVLDEYRVADGSRPNQSDDADFVLTPLLGTREAIIEAEGESPYVVVARISRAELREIGSAKRVTLQGKMGDIEPDVIGTLVTVEGQSGPTGALFDTEGTSREPLALWLVLATLASLLGLGLGLFGTGPRTETRAHS